jgi:hypothetical protein
MMAWKLCLSMALVCLLIALSTATKEEIWPPLPRWWGLLGGFSVLWGVASFIVGLIALIWGV